MSACRRYAEEMTKAMRAFTRAMDQDKDLSPEQYQKLVNISYGELQKAILSHKQVLGSTYDLKKDLVGLKRDNEIKEYVASQNNLVFLSVPETEDEDTKNKLIELIGATIGETVSIMEAERIGKKRENKYRPIRAEFMLSTERNMVFSERKKLGQSISVQEDMPLGFTVTRQLIKRREEEINEIEKSEAETGGVKPKRFRSHYGGGELLYYHSAF